MLNELFSRIGKSVSPSGGGVVAAVSAKKIGFLPNGTFISEETIAVSGDVGGVNANIGTFLRQTFANGTGGTYTQDLAPNWYSYGTELRTENGSYDVYVCSSTYNVGGYTNYWYADGYGGYYTGGSGSYSSYGTYLANCDGQNHYSNGSGGYYSESDGSGGGGGSYYPSYGTSSGNTYSGTNQIDINGSYYDNGSYTSTEYYDGGGGYYYTYSYSYQSYGYNFTSSSYYDDGMMMTVNVYYNSDGNGGYYTSY